MSTATTTGTTPSSDRERLSILAPDVPVQVGADIEQTLDEVFLTPRVLDRGAFERFSSTLAELIRRAGAERQGLEAAAARSERVSEDIRSFQTQHPEAFERTTSLARALAERAEQASALVEQASRRSAELDKRSSAAVARLREGASGFENSIREMLGTLERRVDRIERENEARARRAEMVWSERLASAERRAALLEQRLKEQDEHAAALLARSEAQISTLDTSTESAIERARSGLEEVLLEIEARVASGSERARSVAADAEARVGRALQKTDDLERGLMQVGEMARKLETLSSLIERADELTGEDGVGSLIDRAHEAGARAEFAQKQYDEIAKQADQARRILGESIVESTDVIDKLIERQEPLRESVRHTLELCSKTSAKLSRERGKMKKSIDELMKDAAGRADAIRDAVSAERESLDLAGRATEQLLRTARETVELLRAAVDEARTEAGVPVTPPKPAAAPKKAVRRKRPASPE